MKLGIGSYAFRYNIGVGSFALEHPMDIKTFAYKAFTLGYGIIQICENLHYAHLSNETLAEYANYIKNLGLQVEIGMNGLCADTLKRHLEICKIFDSHFLRIVVGEIAPTQEEMLEKAYQLIQHERNTLDENKIIIGIENHFDLTTENIVRLVKRFQTSQIGAIYDTTNSIGFIEHPEVTLAAMKDVLVSFHLKDYIIKKAEASYVMQGTVLGTGQLALEKVVGQVQKINPNANCILEMTVARNSEDSVVKAAQNELIQVEQSTQALFDLNKLLLS